MNPRILMFLMLAACLSPVTAGPPELKSVDGVLYHMVSAPPERVHVLWTDDGGRPLRTFDAVAKHLAAKHVAAEVLMNGGIFEFGGVPSGLLIQDGKELRPVNRRDGDGNFYLKPNGIFYIGNRGTGILATGDWPPAGQVVRAAVQSGPLLLHRGRVHTAFRRESASRLIRNGVGVTRDRRILLALTDFDSPKLPNLFEFAELFRRLGCDDALFLDGDLSQLRKRGEFNRPGGRFGSFFVISSPN